MVKARVKTPTPTIPEIDAFIDGGGSAPARDEATPLPAAHPVADAKFTWRYGPDLKTRIEAALAARPGKVSLNTWLIEAALEKLSREGR